MLNKVKNIILKTDSFLYKKFGSNKGTKFLENIKEAQIIFSYLNEVGHESKVRFVGGCVRKSICGQTIDDIDLATSLDPDQIKKKLSKENIKLIDTGIEHGTITAIINKKKFEITTLRKDILTDGRHAKVEFISSWEQDASRRDFTINSIYADIEGRIFNPLNGVEDLKNGLIKFIGLPEERMQEDYLRILRYFRFFVAYSKADFDQDIIKSIKKNINGLNKISNERIFDELKKILNLKKSYNLFCNKDSKEIILNIFPQFKHYERLKILNSLDKKFRDKYDNYLILALLIVDQSDNYEYFSHKYKVSNNIKKRFKNISTNYENIKSSNFFSEKNIKKLVYFLNKEYVLDLLLFSICINKKINISSVKKLIEYVNVCVKPKFPISGDFLKTYGYDSGKELGKKLKSLEDKWITNDFIIDKKEVDKYLNKVSKS